MNIEEKTNYYKNRENLSKPRFKYKVKTSEMKEKILLAKDLHE